MTEQDERVARQEQKIANALPVGTPVWWLNGLDLQETQVAEVVILEALCEFPRQFSGYKVACYTSGVQWASADDVFRRPEGRDDLIRRCKRDARFMRETAMEEAEQRALERRMEEARWLEHQREEEAWAYEQEARAYEEAARQQEDGNAPERPREEPTR